MFLKNILVLAPVAVLALIGCDDKNVSKTFRCGRWSYCGA